MFLLLIKEIINTIQLVVGQLNRIVLLEGLMVVTVELKVHLDQFKQLVVREIIQLLVPL